jgi:hypothetical protein
MFILKDHQIYDESFHVIPTNYGDKGTPEQLRDVFGFWFAEIVDIAIAQTFIYRGRQVLADKAEGTGEEILALEKVYYVVATGLVTAHPVGTFGTDYYFCGWAKEDASADDSTVLINFDGTRWNENL